MVNARRFGVDLDPDAEVIVTMGSKEGLASLATAITEPGDVVLAPNPSYPIHTFGFIIAGAAFGLLGVDGALTILFFLLGGIFPGTDGLKVEYEPGSMPKYFSIIAGQDSDWISRKRSRT